MEQIDEDNVVKRPILVTLLCVWCFFTVIWGAYSLYLGLTGPNIEYYTKLYGNIITMALVTSLILLLYLLAGVGLWKMKRWGAIVFVAIIILSIIRSIFLLKNFNISLDWPIVAEFFIIVFYFKRTT